MDHFLNILLPELEGNQELFQEIMSKMEVAMKESYHIPQLKDNDLLLKQVKSISPFVDEFASTVSGQKIKIYSEGILAGYNDLIC